MKPGEHVVDAFLHQLRDGRLERRLVRAKEVPAFLGQLGPKLRRDIDHFRLIGVRPDDSSSIRRRSSVIGLSREPAAAPGALQSTSSFSTQQPSTMEARLSTSLLRRSRSRRMRHASGVVPVRRTRATKLGHQMP